MAPRENNYAFIDGQNLYFNTAKKENGAWKINLARFRIYLKDKYHVGQAFYYLGTESEKYDDLYAEISKAGFTLVFKKHVDTMLGKKKGNVDTDIIFHVMEKLYRKELFNKIIIVSGDGDYKLLVDFLIVENRFKKILFPSKESASSLYQKLGAEQFDYLDNNKIKGKIEFLK